jgi:drug/metabolite transporter (DMT)-like permease
MPYTRHRRGYVPLWLLSYIIPLAVGWLFYEVSGFVYVGVVGAIIGFVLWIMMARRFGR